jgi:enamine deaminase RidA (YjgF/YER057c/UK114 family)
MFCLDVAAVRDRCRWFDCWICPLLASGEVGATQSEIEKEGLSMEKQLVTAPGYEHGLDDRVWSPGIKVGPWLFISGVVSVDLQKGETVGLSGGGPMTPQSIDPEAQWRQCLTNLKAIVEAAGGTLRDVVRADVHVTDMRYYYEYQWIRKEFFEPPSPVCTATAVRGLVHPNWILEIDATAYIEESGNG